MATSPDPGRAKTRLVGAGYPSTWVSSLAASFLLDIFHAATHPALTVRQGAEVLLALDGSPEFLPEPLTTIPRAIQHGNSPGERVVYLCEQSFAEGVEHLVIIVGDTPHLPVAFVQEAFGRLTHGAEAVFGPTEDGGYYLVGLRRHLPALFEGIPWSTGNVLKTTLQAAAQEGTSAASLPTLYAIDTMADVRRLSIDLRRQVVSAPATEAFLAVHPAPDVMLLA